MITFDQCFALFTQKLPDTDTNIFFIELCQDKSGNVCVSNSFAINCHIFYFQNLDALFFKLNQITIDYYQFITTKSLDKPQYIFHANMNYKELL